MNTRRIWTLAVIALVAMFGIAFGRPWIALGVHAQGYPVTGADETANVVIDGNTAYATYASRGIAVIDVSTGKTLRVIPPPSGSVDDLAIAGGFLFALDARPPGALSVFRLSDLSLANAAGQVAVGPFSGVSAANGNVIVSGGTSQMSLRHYDANGKLSEIIATADFGRGQPDVVLAKDGRTAFVSTHYWGPYFGVTVTDALKKRGDVPLDTYGFTSGGAKPASFPLQIALDGEVAVVADANGLTTISGEPKALGHVTLGIEAAGVAVRDHVAAVVGSSPEPRLVFVDVATATAPRVLRSVPLPRDSYPTGVAIGETRVAVAAHRQGVLFIPR